jgi:hypothetical protein
MEIIAATLEVLGEQHRRAIRKRGSQIELGGVLEDFILAVVSIVVIIGVAMYLAGRQTNGGL